MSLGLLEGVTDGAMDMEGMPEGFDDGRSLGFDEGMSLGLLEGVTDGAMDGNVLGMSEGLDDGT